MFAVELEPNVAGALAVAVADFRRRYDVLDPRLLSDLETLQQRFTKAARRGQGGTTFDADAFCRDLGVMGMRPLVVTLREAGVLLSCSPKTIARRVRAGELETVGDGPAVRVVTASIEAFVERSRRTAGTLGCTA